MESVGAATTAAMDTVNTGVATVWHNQQQLEAEVLSLNSAFATGQLLPSDPKAEAPTLPALRWDTSVLDIEEDRVIWVRESDLGQTVREEPEGPFYTQAARSSSTAARGAGFAGPCVSPASKPPGWPWPRCSSTSATAVTCFGRASSDVSFCSASSVLWSAPAASAPRGGAARSTIRRGTRTPRSLHTYRSART